MTSMKTLAFAAALIGSALPLTAAAFSRAERGLPHVVTGRVLDAEDGTPAGGLAWRAWSELDPAAQSSGRAGDGVVGVHRSDGTFGDLASIAGPGTSATPWIVVVEGTVDGGGYFAVGRSLSGAAPVVVPQSRLVPVPAPAATGEPSGVRLTWAAATDGGSPLGPASGLTGYSVERAGADANYTAVGRVPASGDPSFLDARVPDGQWTYALRPIFTGDVVGQARSRESSPVTMARGPDTDADGVHDSLDNCRRFANEDQVDSDGDGVADACDFLWADVAPAGLPDGRVNIGDVVRLLRMSIGLEPVSAEDLRRANVAPAAPVTDPAEALVPTLELPQVVDVGDVILTLRASVGLARFVAPE